MFNFSFRHKDDEFFDLFIESAKFFHEGTLKLHTVVNDYSQAETLMKDIIDIEHKADDINDKIIDELTIGEIIGWLIDCQEEINHAGLIK